MGMLFQTRQVSGMVRRLVMVACVAYFPAIAGCHDVLDTDFCDDKSRIVGRVTVSPKTLTVRVGQFSQVGVEVLNQRGDFTLCLEFPAWSSADQSIATVNSGIPYLDAVYVHGVNPGTTYIRATSNGVVDSLKVTVTP